MGARFGLKVELMKEAFSVLPCRHGGLWRFSKGTEGFMGLRVLVADDEEDILEIIQDRLEACGFNVITAANGAEALRRITTEKFDGVFLDVKMPEMSGIEVLEEVRKRDTRLPIIIIKIGR